MMTLNPFERRRSPRSPHEAWRGMAGTMIIGLGLALTACGGGSGSTGSVAGPTTGASSTGTGAGTGTTNPGDVTVRIVTASGVPVPGAGVDLNGGFDGRSLSTDAEGYARFTGIPAGPARLHSDVGGFHDSSRRIEVVSARDTQVTLAVMAAAAATPVILGHRAVPSADGRTLTVEVDVAVLGPNGAVVPTFTAADFTPIDSDCAFRPCGIDVGGGFLPMGGYMVKPQAEAFAWSGGGTTRPLRVGLLLDQSEAMADFDPQRLRIGGINAWLGSIVPPSAVGLATYRGLPATPVLTTYGAFTSDTADLRGVVAGLSGQEGGTNAIDRGVYDMLTYTATAAASGPDDPPRTVVLVTGGAWDFGCHDELSCLEESESIDERSLTLGIPVTTLGGAEIGVSIAMFTGGAAAVITDPSQYPVAMTSLDAIAGKSLGFNRVRWVLDPVGTDPARRGPVFRPGQLILTYLSVRVAPDVDLFLTIPVPIR
jgi:Carboxypeptidase regulatory-like domain